LSGLKGMIQAVVMSAACFVFASPAALAERSDTARPQGLDEQSWASLKRAVAQAQGITAPSRIRLEGTVSSLGNEGSANDQFGHSVDLDGDTAIVGIPQDSSGGGYSGSAYVFQWDGSVWQPQAKLVAEGSRRLGTDVAIEGDTAVVGAPYTRVDDSQDQGAVWVFTRADGVWSQQTRLTAADGASSELFGSSVAVSKDRILVGAERAAATGGFGHGAAYVFARQGASWAQQAKLEAPDGASSDLFGSSVALEGDAALVGAYFHNVEGRAQQGAVYAFQRLQSAWPFQAKLVASDGAQLDHFGKTLDLQGGRAVIAAERSATDTTRLGAAYVFVRQGTSWAEEAKLMSWDSGLVQSGFGSSVGISGDLVLVGAPEAFVGSNLSRGAAYVFRRTAQGWTPEQKLSGSEVGSIDDVAFAIAVDAGRVLLGAPKTDVGENTDQGAVYAFALQGSTWSQRGKLSTGAGSGHARFGASVDVDGRTAVVGADWETVGANPRQGAAYVFRKSAGEWLLEARLTASDGQLYDLFGSAVGISGNTVVVGAPSADFETQPDRGAIYVFDRIDGNWTERDKLGPPGGESPVAFASSLSIDGDSLLVGTGSDDFVGTAIDGAAYVFQRSGSDWSFQQRLAPISGAQPEKFGYSVAIEGDTALVGSPLSDEGGLNASGAAYLFQRHGELWVEQQRLFAEDGAAGDLFGYSVGLSGNTAIVAAPSHVGGTGGWGAVFIYRRGPVDWALDTKFPAPGTMLNGYFANSVALSGEWAFATFRRSLASPPGVLLLVRQDGVWTSQAEWPQVDGAGDAFPAALAFDGASLLIGSPQTSGPPPYGNASEGVAFLYPNVTGLFEDGFESNVLPEAREGESSQP
jgi:hypothetical protein